MFNDRLSDEGAKELIDQRVKEAEACSQQKQLGFGDSRATRWALLLTIIVAVLVVSLLL